MAVSTYHIECQTDRGEPSHLPIENPGKLIGEKLAATHPALSEIIETAIYQCCSSRDGFKHHDCHDTDGNDGSEGTKILGSNLLHDKDQG